MLILIVILYIFWLPPCSLRWEESSSHEKMEIHLSFLISVKKKKVLAVLRTKLAYFGLCFYLLFSPQLCLLCACFSFSVSSESYVDITQCEAWGLKRLGHEVQVHRDFCLITPQTLRLQTSYTRDIIFSNTNLPSRLAVNTPACWWFVRAGMLLSILLTLGLNFQFCHINKYSFLLKWRV